MFKKLILGLLCGAFFTGCSVVSYNRVFPKFTWYWASDAVQQRKDKAQEKAWDKEQSKTNSVH